jgi:phenylacetate-CoA ligase
MKPIHALPPTRLQPAERTRETLLQLVSDLIRQSWVKVDARHYLDDYVASQWLPPTALKQLQLAKLRRLVWHCFLQVPYYRGRLAGAIAPSEIEALESPAPLPVVAAGPWRSDEARAETEEIAVERRTAGTRGQALPVFVDAAALERQVALRLRSERWAGAPPGRVVALWGHDLLRAPRPFVDGEVRSLGSALARTGRAVVSGPGSSLGELAEGLGAAGRWSWRSIGRAPLEASAVIVRGEDPSGGGTRLAKRMGARAVSWYGTAEHGVIAAPCERSTAMHVHADHLLVEIVDDCGRVLPPGTAGRVVVTDLHNYAAPYLRYDLGDEGRLLPQPCPCGRALPLFELIGRATPR